MRLDHEHPLYFVLAIAIIVGVAGYIGLEFTKSNTEAVSMEGYISGQLIGAHRRTATNVKTQEIKSQNKSSQIK